MFQASVDCLPSPIGFRVLYSDIHTLIYKNRFNGVGAFYITYIHIKSNSLHISAKKIVYPPQVAIYSKGPAGKKHMGLMGIYVKMDDTMLNGRPVYEMKGGKYKLFVNPLVTCSNLLRAVSKEPHK